MNAGRKRVWIWVAAVFGVLAITASIALTSRKRSAFDYLYALGPEIGECKPKMRSFGTGKSTISAFTISATGGAQYFVIAGASPAKIQTVLVFPANKVKSVTQLLESKFKTTRTLMGNGTWQDMFEFGTDSKNMVIFGTGSYADGLVAGSRLTVPRGGCAVTISEAPDWFSLRLNAFLRFFHLR